MAIQGCPLVDTHDEQGQRRLLQRLRRCKGRVMAGSAFHMPTCGAAFVAGLVVAFAEHRADGVLAS